MYAHIPTGEVRPPAVGEFYESEAGIRICSLPYIALSFPIYRRIDYAVLTGLVKELADVLDWCYVERVPLRIQEIDSITSALAAAREVGLGVGNG